MNECLRCFFAKSSTNDPAMLNKPAVLNTANSSNMRTMTFCIISSICYRCDLQHDSAQRNSNPSGSDLVLQKDLNKLVLQTDIAEHSSADAACSSMECATSLNRRTIEISCTEGTALRDTRQALPAPDHLDMAKPFHTNRPTARPVTGVLLKQHVLQGVIVMDRQRRGGATRGRGRSRGRSVPAGRGRGHHSAPHTDEHHAGPQGLQINNAPRTLQAQSDRMWATAVVHCRGLPQQAVPHC